MNHRSRRMLSGFVVLAALAVPSAVSAVPVNLRIEGPSATLFEASVTVTPPIPRFSFTGEAPDHLCDTTGPASQDFNGQGASTTPQLSRGSVLMAAKASGLTLTGTFSTQYGNPTFSTINGTSVAFDSSTSKYLGEFENGTPAAHGACGDPISANEQVLFGFSAFGDNVLALTGPSAVTSGTPFTVSTTDAASPGTGLTGATIRSFNPSDGTLGSTLADNTTTSAVQICLSGSGTRSLKAERSGSVRSNALTVTVTGSGSCSNGSGGGSGGSGATTTDPGSPSGGTDPGVTPPADTPPLPAVPLDVTAPRSVIAGIANGAVFAKGKGPRELRGAVGEAASTRGGKLVADPSGIREIKLRLARTVGKRCFSFSGKSERFRGAHCGVASASFFSIGAKSPWRYLLPTRLPRGSYVLDVKATDRAGNTDKAVRLGSNRVRFVVR